MALKVIKVAIVGVTGYSGLELLRLLKNHRYVEIVSIHNTANHSRMIAEAYPHLKGMYKITTTPFDPLHIMQEADIVFFATSSGVSKDLVAPFIAAHFPVIDLSGDFRLPAEDYASWYHKTPAPQTLIDQTTYSLADFYSASTTNYIANPGCYATATLLALAPIAQHHLLDKHNIIIDAKSGLSGAGKSLTTASHFINANENVTMYKVNQHQHIPEITRQLQKWQPNIEHIQFNTSLIPINRGIFISAYVKLNEDTSLDVLHRLYTSTYYQKPFIRVMPEGTLPNIKQVVGTNFADIGLAYNQDTKYLTIVSVIDNMIKGAAGQAIQNMNHLFGFDETMGLELIAQYA
jgi:N-acetyl-gamma-glutamyl-phosphate reductase